MANVLSEEKRQQVVALGRLGWSLDDKREKVTENDIPDVIVRWRSRDPAKDTDRTANAFFVPVVEIRENGFDLSINRYKDLAYEAASFEPPQEILNRMRVIEANILRGLDDLEALLK